MRYLHTMVRVSDVDASLHFYCDLLGLELVKTIESEKGRFTNYFLCTQCDKERYEAYAIARARADLQLGSGDLFRRQEFWSSCLSCR
jgi:catechol 2,3-dioxygenase-like lactoylglutathione lyase family enzyme